MKIAFAHWRDRIAPVFDTAKQVRVVEVESGRVISEMEENLPEDLIIQKALRLLDLEIHTLVCGAVSRPMHGLIHAYGIQVIPFVAGELSEVIQAWLGGNLSSNGFSMPGCRRQIRRHSRGMLNTDPLPNVVRRKRARTAGNRRRQAKSGPGLVRMGRTFSTDVVGYCVCPKCGRRQPYENGVHCVERQCPECGIAMARLSP